MDGGTAIAAVDATVRELALFACVGFLIGGIDDMAVDLIALARRDPRASPLEPRPAAHRLAIFLPAWDEAAVIGRMLRRALDAFDHPDFRIYVGCYPNDASTIAAVAQIATADARVRLAINAHPGPTTKGDNLNSLWRALGRDEAAERWHADAIVLHDAEDVVHPAELITFDRLLADHAVIQLPVVPLIPSTSRWVSAHYADEFAEAHTRALVVREALGAGLPLAGVGCTLRRDALETLAAGRGGDPFDAASLVEDYELGLTIAAAGGRGCFARVSAADGSLVCVRAIFPTTLVAAARQKARWMAGIALLGWDRLGWGRALQIGEHWMRMRDRRAPLAVLVLAAAYLSLVMGLLATAAHLATGRPPPALPPILAPLLTATSAVLVWRMAMRGWATGRLYGWREGARAILRTVVANYVALMAAWRAVGIYVAALRGQPTRWDKTAHSFPDAA